MARRFGQRNGIEPRPMGTMPGLTAEWLPRFWCIHRTGNSAGREANQCRVIGIGPPVVGGLQAVFL